MSRTHSILERCDMLVYQKKVLIDGEDMEANFLRCSFSDRGVVTTPFYALADPLECGAVFIFSEKESGGLELYSRVTKIATLLNPVGPKEIKLHTREGTSDGKRAKPSSRKRQRTKFKKQEDFSDEESRVLLKSTFGRRSDNRKKRTNFTESFFQNITPIHEVDH